MRNLYFLYYFILEFNFVDHVFYCYINNKIIKNDKNVNANLTYKNKRINLSDNNDINYSNEIKINLDDDSSSTEEENIFYDNKVLDNFGYEKILLIYLIYHTMI